MFSTGDRVYGHSVEGLPICGTVFSSTHSDPFEVVVVCVEVEELKRTDEGYVCIAHHPVYGMLSLKFSLIKANGRNLNLYTQETVQ